MLESHWRECLWEGQGSGVWEGKGSGSMGGKGSGSVGGEGDGAVPMALFPWSCCLLWCRDDDMQSTFSAVSVGEDRSVYDDEDEEDEEEDEFAVTTATTASTMG